MSETTTYNEFLSRKATTADKPGPNMAPSDVHPLLHDWQNDLVRWAVCTSRAAIWADTGMGKTMMQLEWARLSGNRSLIVAPLAVCAQTVREAAKIGIHAEYVREYADVDPLSDVQVHVTNYERLQGFPPAAFDAVVLDESSILKQSTGATRTMLIDWAREVPHRLACSATPAPNAIRSQSRPACARPSAISRRSRLRPTPLSRVSRCREGTGMAGTGVRGSVEPARAMSRAFARPCHRAARAATHVATCRHTHATRAGQAARVLATDQPCPQSPEILAATPRGGIFFAAGPVPGCRILPMDAACDAARWT